jgi:replicative DNA helicase
MQLPASRESEEALLGAILIDPSTLNFLKIAPEDFFIVRNQMIYRAMRAIGPSELDLVSLTEVLSRKGQIDEIGGQAYIIGLINKSGNAYHYDIYERAIIDSARRRRVLRSCNQLASAAYEMDKPIGDAVSRVMSDLVKAAKPIGGAVHIKEFLGELYEEMEERAADPKEIYGLETGIRDFDLITAGLQKGEEFILAGQPGTGKSLLAFQMACGMAGNGHSGAIYSLEMTGVAMVRRRLSAISKIKTYNLRSGVDLNKNWDKVLKAIEQMEKLPIFISDTSDWTTIQMRADLSRLKQQEGIEFFVVDYHDLLSDPFGKDAIEKSAYISQQLHGICKDLDLAGVVIQSLNKAGYHQTPTMANLSGSTKVMHTADHIAFMTEDKKQKNLVHLTWDKVREGESKRWMDLYKVDSFPAFYEVAQNDTLNDYTK